MRRAGYCRAILIAVLVPLMGSHMGAQVTGTIQAHATVVASLTVSGDNDLEFGNVTPGVPKSVQSTEVGSAGEWTIVAGGPSAEVTLAFTIPPSLSSSGNNLPVQFAAGDAAYANTALASQTSPTMSIDPGVMTTANLDGVGGMVVWIGGTAVPGVSQAAGDYTGQIQMTVTLTGN